MLGVVEVPEVMRRVLLCMLEAVDGDLSLLEVLEVPAVIRCVLLCTLEAVEGRLCIAGGVGGDTLCGTLHAEGRGG